MKIGTWNVRGLKHPLKRNGIQSFIKQHDINVMCLLAKKLGEPKMDRIMRNKFGGYRKSTTFVLIELAASWFCGTH